MKGKIVFKRRLDARGEWVETPVYSIDGREVTAREFRRAFPDKPIGAVGGQQTTTWPLVSEALAVHPDQVAEANARAKRHGIPVTYDAAGMCHIPDNGARRRLLKLEGYHDRSAFS